MAGEAANDNLSQLRRLRAPVRTSRARAANPRSSAASRCATTSSSGEAALLGITVLLARMGGALDQTFVEEWRPGREPLLSHQPRP